MLHAPVLGFSKTEQPAVVTFSLCPVDQVRSRHKSGIFRLTVQYISERVERTQVRTHSRGYACPRHRPERSGTEPPKFRPTTTSACICCGATNWTATLPVNRLPTHHSQ
ncbi:hypothetical protein QBC35DRAFT_170500 [Podospora australis]|uniref:Uncharacterized protein n=1 Tax=Podospora australis TaxID=1536484 RepID=A0AAN7AK61_9PEZI|nr:hypothetical protein QBC35DRAFT_170500 [Podospora australis]